MDCPKTSLYACGIRVSSGLSMLTQTGCSRCMLMTWPQHTGAYSPSALHRLRPQRLSRQNMNTPPRYRGLDMSEMRAVYAILPR